MYHQFSVQSFDRTLAQAGWYRDTIVKKKLDICEQRQVQQPAWLMKFAKRLRRSIDVIVLILLTMVGVVCSFLLLTGKL